MTKIYNKLVRDKIPERILADGQTPVIQNLRGEVEFDRALREKILEEASEVADAKDRDEIRTELADLLEVMRALGAHWALSMDEVEACRSERARSRGAFDQRIFLIRIDSENA